MIAAEHPPILFQAVADDAHPAMLARRGQPMDRTFKTVEDIGSAAHSYFERLVVVIAASIAFRHSASG
jgi:hypothetical protein